MKKLKSLLFGLGAIALLGACSNDRDNYEGRDPSGKNDVTFNSNITSRAVSRAIDSDWASGDAIGVYAVKAGTTLNEADIFDGKSNIKHTTISAGKTAKFVAANPTQAIALDGKTTIDVVAYYPYTSVVTDFLLSLDVTDQSKPQDIDVLYSNNLKGIQKAGPANMTFSHQLSKLVFVVEPTADYPSLTGLGAKDLAGLTHKGSFDLKTATIALSGSAATIQPKVSGSSVSAILIPGQKLDQNVSVKFTLGAEEFTWTPKKELNLTSGTKYTFRIQLSKDGSVATLNPEGNIEDWVEGNDDNGVDIVTPGGEDPDPKPTDDIMSMADFITKYAAATQEAPITITEDITLKGLITANDAGKNIDKKIFVADATGAMGFFIFTEGSLATDYKVGQEIEIKVKGLAMTAFGDAKQVAAPNEGGKNKTKAIELANFKAIAKITNSSISTVTPVVLTLNQVNASYINKLIEVQGVEFQDAGQPFTVDGKHTNRVVTSADGTLIVRTRGTADFAQDILPSGKVTVVGIVDSYKGELQLLPRTLADIKEDGGTTPGTDLTVDKSSLSFAKEGSSQPLTITSAAAWTITSDAAWLTTDVTSGNGNQTINVQALVNSGNARSGKLTITSGQSVAVVNVSQAAGTSQPGVEQVVFLETFGVNTGAKEDVNFVNFDAYPNFSSKANNVVVSNKGSRADIRSRANVMNFELLAWMPSFNPQYPYDEKNPAPTVSFSNIDTQGMTDIKLTYDLSANFSGKTANVNYAKVYIDGQEIAVPDITLDSKEYNNAYYTVELSIDKSFSTLEFITTTYNNTGIRLDNVKVTGKK